MVPRNRAMRLRRMLLRPHCRSAGSPVEMVARYATESSRVNMTAKFADIDVVHMHGRAAPVSGIDDRHAGVVDPYAVVEGDGPDAETRRYIARIERDTRICGDFDGRRFADVIEFLDGGHCLSVDGLGRCGGPVVCAGRYRDASG